MNSQNGLSAFALGAKFVSTESTGNTSLMQRGKPPSETQSLVEAFNALIYTQCREQLNLSVDLLRTGMFGSGAVQQSSAVRKVGIQFERALKILTCTSIHLSGVENGGAESPPWFLDFLFRSLRAADLKCNEPPARAIITKFGSCNGRLMACLAAEDSLAELGVTERQAIEKLGYAIHSATPLRLEILLVCLSGEKDILRQRVSSNFLQKLASAVY